MAKSVRAGSPASDGALFGQPCRFVLSAAKVSDLPPPDRPEIAFAGRSNAGKSSLLNALVGRKALAHVSGTPGRTRLVNLFAVGDALYLADLPGYGYARAPGGVRAAWAGLVEHYLTGRPNLRRVCLLIDARVGLKPSDNAAMHFLASLGLSFQVVLTKIDRLNAAARAEARAAAEECVRAHGAAFPALAETSAKTKDGIGALRASLAQLAG